MTVELLLSPANCFSACVSCLVPRVGDNFIYKSEPLKIELIGLF